MCWSVVVVVVVVIVALKSVVKNRRVAFSVSFFLRYSCIHELLSFASLLFSLISLFLFMFFF